MQKSWWWAVKTGICSQERPVIKRRHRRTSTHLNSVLGAPTSQWTQSCAKTTCCLRCPWRLRLALAKKPEMLSRRRNKALSCFKEALTSRDWRASMETSPRVISSRLSMSISSTCTVRETLSSSTRRSCWKVELMLLASAAREDTVHLTIRGRKGRPRALTSTSVAFKARMWLGSPTTPSRQIPYSHQSSEFTLEHPSRACCPTYNNSIKRRNEPRKNLTDSQTEARVYFALIDYKLTILTQKLL